VGLGSISTANATMVRDDYTATISRIRDVSGFTSGEQLNFSVTYDNANFTRENTTYGYVNNFLNPIFDLGSFTSLFPSIDFSHYIFQSFGALYEGFEFRVFASDNLFEGSSYFIQYCFLQ
jgi:hypothetical protein